MKPLAAACQAVVPQGFVKTSLPASPDRQSALLHTPAPQAKPSNTLTLSREAPNNPQHPGNPQPQTSETLISPEPLYRTFRTSLQSATAPAAQPRRSTRRGRPRRHGRRPQTLSPRPLEALYSLNLKPRLKPLASWPRVVMFGLWALGPEVGAWESRGFGAESFLLPNGSELLRGIEPTPAAQVRQGSATDGVSSPPGYKVL